MDTDYGTYNITDCRTEDVIDATANDTSLSYPVKEISIILLGVIDIVVILGNTLVIAAVCTTRKLRTVTNIFIVSLALSDLFLGCVILPFSITNHVLKHWIFGRTMCISWLAVDVWISTASILNLCAISFDRYIAITHPIRYPNILSTRRARILTAGVWILAFAICFPPLVEWDTKSNTDTTNLLTTTTSIMTYIENEEFTDGKWDIYPGLNTMNISILFSNFVNVTSPPNDVLTYEIELSTSLSNSSSNSTPRCVCQLFDAKEYIIYSALGSFFVPMSVMVFFYIRIYIAAVRTASSMRKGVMSMKSDDNTNPENQMVLRIHRGGGSNRTEKKPICNGSSKSKTSDNGSSLPRSKIFSYCGKAPRPSENDHNSITEIGRSPDRKRRNYDEGSNEHIANISYSIEHRPIAKDPKKPKRNKLVVKHKHHNRKFQRETKAAKTLAIIVGAFIFCWLPFFTCYLINAFCKDKSTICISEAIMDVFFWLGYCNSALNPFIYALYARDFREAFKRILCRPCRKYKTIHSRSLHTQSTDISRNVLNNTISAPKESESASDL